MIAVMFVAVAFAVAAILVPTAKADSFGDPVYGPTPGSGSFVPGTLKCYGTQDPTSKEWSLIIEGDWVSQRRADFSLYYYGASDPESSPDVSQALGPVIDSNYHVTLGDVELSQPTSHVLVTDGKPRHLKFELDGVDPTQAYTLGGVWKNSASSLDSGKMYPVVTMRVINNDLCNL